MFRVTVQEPDAATTSNATTIVLEGRLCGPWVDELDRCWRTVGPVTRGRLGRLLHQVRTHLAPVLV